MDLNPMTTLVDDEDETQLTSPKQAQGESPKKRRSKRQYVHSHSYESKEKAVAALEEDLIWSSIGSRKTKEGLKLFYRCKLAPYRGNQCSASVYILLHSHNLEASIFKTQCK